jgi:sugar (pentulose or hexulose) kinase
MSALDIWTDPAWVQSLSDFLGCPLAFVEGSESLGGNAAAAALRGRVGPPRPGVTLELLVKVLTTRMDDGSVAVWALVFFYVDKRRVAEEGKSHLAIEWRDGAWHRRHWEEDEYDEWAELETLD